MDACCACLRRREPTSPPLSLHSPAGRLQQQKFVPAPGARGKSYHHRLPRPGGGRRPPAYDRVNIAKLGHAEANTNFPAAEYRDEWELLEAVGAAKAVEALRDTPA